MCHRRRTHGWDYKPMSLYTLIPDLGYTDRDWTAEELPELVYQCGSCAGLGRSDQVFTVGCGGGTFTSRSKCDRCGGIGLRYFNGGEVPLSVVNQILVARTRMLELA